MRTTNVRLCVRVCFLLVSLICLCLCIHQLSHTYTVCDVMCNECGMAAMWDAANDLNAVGAAILLPALEKMTQLRSLNFRSTWKKKKKEKRILKQCDILVCILACMDLDVCVCLSTCTFTR